MNDQQTGATNAIQPREETARSVVKFQPEDLWPRSWNEANQMAALLCKTTLIPKHLQGNQANTLYTILAGLELGVSPTVACREIYFVDGKPNCSSLLKVGLVLGNRYCEKWQELKSTNEECTYAARRRGDKQDTIRTVSIKDAERAGLLNKDNWRKWPGAMLRRRCQGQLADDLFPDVVRGLGSADEDFAIAPAEVRWAERVTPITNAPPPQAQAQQQPAPTTDQPKEQQAEPEQQEAPQGDPGAPDAIDVLLNELEMVDNLAGVDAISKRASDLIPKGHTRRQEVGKALNAARARVKS